MSKKFFHTLRFRLTLWNTAVVMLASGLALVAVRTGMRLNLEQDARLLLREETAELAMAVVELRDETAIRDEFERKILSHSQHGWFGALLSDAGNQGWQSDNFPKEMEQKINAGISNGTAVESLQLANHIVVRRSIDTGNGQTQAIVLGEPALYIEDDIRQLTRIMLWIGAGLALIAPIGGYYLARHATRPVREIIRTTRQLEPSRLHQRLPIRGSNDELDQISHEINLFVDQISRYLESHREFIANAAHELRSPLTAILTSVEVTLDKPRTVDEYIDQLETVNEQCQQLRHLVNQLLDLAESDAQIPRSYFRSVDLSALLAASVDFFEGVAEEKRIVVATRLDTNVIMHGDESKLRQVANNLLDNALKFTPEGGRVDVELVAVDNEIRLNVDDSGPGIPAEDLQKIFERFYQVDSSRNRGPGHGNGLGLSICKSAVELHGGAIAVRNLATQGFRVEVRFQRSAGNS